MVGIVSYGAYIPMWRIDRDEIAKASGSPSMGGERAVASWDEDSLTMALEAGSDCLSGFDPKEIDAVYFATVSSPFKEKQVSSIIASALDMRRDVLAGDFTTSLKAGTFAVKVACDAIKSESAKMVLVVAADSRKAMPKSEFEQINGDGAAALLIGGEGIIAKIEGFSSVLNPILGSWRREEDDYPRRFEPKLDRIYGLLKDIPKTVNDLLKNLNLESSDISKFALYGPDPRAYHDLARVLGISQKLQSLDPLFETVGITGTPHCLLLLVSALEQAKQNERIICASYGEGSDAFLVRATEKIGLQRGKKRGTRFISSKRMIPSYGHFEDFQGTRETGWPPKQQKASLVKYWRDEKWELPLYGMKCNKCGTLQFPIARCCMICGEKDNHDRVKIAKKGHIYTYTHDYLMGPGLIPGNGINPATRVVADMEDGCRLWFEMTDHEIEEVDIGMAIEVTFRVIHQKGYARYYGWRLRPARG
jgi:3-hydroxy-3-methylglutaryl CoA synthase